ncbi:sigma-54-dependent Fis family transcriptional regulator [Chitinophaga parva]|uniref:Sigma-54-dependent Fis family transcriptional regulator n=1 Tax=Chitinophaga parva TaxID=2169414 RepID=A0A2T7BQF0_9BACT|nr:sigma-54-dependent Fis family transcriptional regulator [Chitinophaga parva]
MPEKILIVEDEFIVANDLRIILQKAGYRVLGVASSVAQARTLLALERPDWVLLDIILKGPLAGTVLAQELNEAGIPFLYISANTDAVTLEAVKITTPYGFLIKPFRERDLLVMLDIARYRVKVEASNLAPAATTPAPVEDIRSMLGLIGESPALARVMEKIALVAPTATSVLITGESGTGKEKVAQAIHQLSAHHQKPMVTVNCAALPAALIESELFGYEKGAFTGAQQRRVGKFEQADNGTIFLDEIGELSLEAQAKILRVLQEKEIERLGSESPIQIQVRIIAATNRDLEKEVANGKFRLDLYYRLNVFPLPLPPLRERREDIAALAMHFLRRYAHQARKKVNTITEPVLQQLRQYNWPGNVRELEHVIERQVLMTEGTMLTQVELPELHTAGTPAAGRLQTLEEVERQHILHALKTCHGKVFGPGGAAEALHIPATTLYSKMKKLGIKQGYA